MATRQLLLDLRPVVRRHARLAPEADVAAFDRLVVRMLRERPGPLVSVLRQPTVSTLVRTLRRADAPGDAAVFRELLGLVPFELAVLGELPFAVRLAHFPRRALSLAGRFALEFSEDDPGTVTLTSGRMQVTGTGGTRSLDLPPPDAQRPYTVVTDDLVLATRDNNPLALFEAHPDKLGNAVDLGDAPVSAWTASLRDALSLVGEHLPDLRAEMALYISQLVPVGVHATKHLSASYQEAIGTIYLTLHPSLLTMTEALIHEFSHNKLNALFELDPLLENAFAPLFRSPVRPDARPLHGVLLAVHAFIPVARLYERMRDVKHPLAAHASFQARFEQIVGINREAAEVVLSNGVPTPVGAGLLDEIRRWDTHYR